MKAIIPVAGAGTKLRPHSYTQPKALIPLAGKSVLSIIIDQLKQADFLTGLIKSAVFGLILGLIACRNGLRVEGGAAGVGKATTDTVVQTVVVIVLADLLFTSIFYAIGWT